jgi:hypothetical protein
LAALGIEQLAGDVGEEQFLGIGIDQLVETAFAAAVAQALPLGLAHLAHLLGLPERLIAIRHRHLPRASSIDSTPNTPGDSTVRRIAGRRPDGACSGSRSVT